MLLFLLACTSQEVVQTPPKDKQQMMSEQQSDELIDEPEDELTDSNTPPIIIKAAFVKENPTVKDKIEVVVNAKDQEKQVLRYDYAWKIAGQKYPSETRAKLRKAEFKRGDEIEVIVTISDGTLSTEKTIKTTVQNASPEWNAGNPNTMKLILQRLQNNNLVLKAEDPDGDKIHYKLEGAPAGMNISSSGTLSYTGSEEEPGGQYSIKIIAEDSHKESIHMMLPITLNPGSKAKK